MNIYIACELGNLEKKIIKNNLKKHNLYFSNLSFKKIVDNNFLKCEIVFGNIPPDWIKQSRKIRWLQLESTGFAEYSNVKGAFFSAPPSSQGPSSSVDLVLYPPCLYCPIQLRRGAL